MKDTTLSAITTGMWTYAGSQVCLNAGSYTIPAVSSGNWFSIPLQTPFYHNPTKSIFVDISSTSSTTGPVVLESNFWSGAHITSGTTGASTGPYGNSYTFTFGFDYAPPFSYNDAGVLSIDSPYSVCVGSSNTFKATIKNYGHNQITSVSVNWSVNGTSQFPAYYSSTLDTVGGSGSNTAQITLGTATPSSAPAIIRAWTAYPNSVADTVPGNDSASATKNSAMYGTYTIGSSGATYPTFAAAIYNIQTYGICGPIIFNVMSGTYNEAIVLPPIPGTSATKTVTFQSMANVPDSVIVSDNTAIPLTLSGSFIKFKSIEFYQVAAAANCIVVSGSPSYDTIYNCKIIAGSNSTNTNYTFHGNGASMNNVVLRKNIFSGSSYGLNFYSSPNWSVNCVIDSNTFQNAYNTPVYYLYNTINLKFRNNIINVNGTGTSGAMNLQGNDSAFEFASNQINISSGITENINLGFYNIGNATNLIKVYNNIFIGGTAVFNAYFFDNYVDIYNNVFNSAGYLDFGYLSSNMRFYNNTINSTSSTNAAFTLHNVSSTSLDVRNNVFANTGGSYALNWSASPTNEICDNNNYYATGTNLIYNSGTSAAYTTISSWKSATGKDSNSISYRPAFTSSTNLQPNISDSACWSLNGRGIHLPGIVSKDINGNNRPASLAAGVPDIGAYEFTPSVAPPFANASPASPAAGTTQTFTFGGDTIEKIVWAPASTVPSSIGVQQYSGTIPPQIGSVADYMWFYTNTTAPAGTYNYSLNLYYKNQWMGTCPSELNLILAKKNSSTAWTTYASSTVDTFRNIISTSSLNSFSYFTGSDATVLLPVKLIDFTANKIENSVLLNWATSNEINSDRFEVERKNGSTQEAGGSWEMIGKVKGHVTSNVKNDYQFIDASTELSIPNLSTNQPINLFYRLKEIDKDGSFDYSKTVSVNWNEINQNSIVVFPNPVSGNENLLVKFNSNSIQGVTVEMTDLTGKTIVSKTQTISTNNNLIELDLTNKLRQAIYFLKISDANSGLIKIQKVAVVK
ncbi:MAG: T9SS type A sorting domain-containing protein [Bacteroidia bacterium]